MRGAEDELHLKRAASEGRVLMSGNRKHFYALHTRWLADGQHHGDILLMFSRAPVGRVIERMLQLEVQYGEAGMRDRVVFVK